MNSVDVRCLLREIGDDWRGLFETFIAESSMSRRKITYIITSKEYSGYQEASVFSFYDIPVSLPKYLLFQKASRVTSYVKYCYYLRAISATALYSSYF